MPKPTRTSNNSRSSATDAGRRDALAAMAQDAQAAGAYDGAMTLGPRRPR